MSRFDPWKVQPVIQAPGQFILVTQPFQGSLMQQLGFIEECCPHCKAHLYEGGICLNACTLTAYLYRKLQQRIVPDDDYLTDAELLTPDDEHLPDSAG